MLKESGIEFEYRDYKKQPLSSMELRGLFRELGMEPSELLRTRDAANRSLGLNGSESSAELIQAMSENPTLLQRPIGRRAGRAVVGRPPDRLLEL